MELLSLLGSPMLLWGHETRSSTKHVTCSMVPSIVQYIFPMLFLMLDLGARFGPRAIRAASARQTSFRGFNPRRGLNPYSSPYFILDCGDIPITPFDNALALRQMSEAFLELGSRKPALSHSLNPKPKLLTLGGDHSIALPALRALNKIHGGPVAVLHFDAHL